VENDPASNGLLEEPRDERNQFIRDYAGAKAFWITYWAVFTLIILSQIVSINMNTILIGLIIGMPIVYFSLLGLGMKKY